jgi:Bacterial Ig-like domain (group 2)
MKPNIRLLLVSPISLLIGIAGCGNSHDPATMPIPVVSITPTSATVQVGHTQQFTATVQNSSNTAVTWQVNGTTGGDSSHGTISNSGLYTAPSSVPSPATVTVAAIAQADPTKSASASVLITMTSVVSPGVFTHHNDNARSGQNLQEIILTPANVNQTQFGKIFSCAVDGYVYAQPLYVPNLVIPRAGTRNAVLVATEHDSVFAFDADNPACLQLWTTSFINPAAGITTVPSDDVDSGDISPEVGITGTPVIDPQSNTLYVVARTKENGSYFQRLHALDIATGAEKFGAPVVIQASVPGTGDASVGGIVSFDALRENQRTALLLSNGVVYAAFASIGDVDPYHGWLLGYNATTLQRVAVFNTTPDGSQGGIWQSGGGPSADSDGNIYVVVGNGTFDADVGARDFGDSFLKLSTSAGGFNLADFFTPHNQADLSANDFDLGSTDPLLLPDQTGTAHPHLVLAAGKDGNGYLVDRDNMGHFNPNDNHQIVQTIAVSSSGFFVFSSPAFWQNNVYFAPNRESLKAFHLSGGLLSASPTSQSSATFGYGATPSISANGSTNGIVWLLDSGGYQPSTPAILYAYDATDVSKELYDSTLAGDRDRAGLAVSFAVPMVANGKVYVGGQFQLTVFGPLP